MKDGNWIALDKNLVHFLPRDRSYTILEAMFSYSLDVDNNEIKSEVAYSRIWSWSRTKVRRFIADVKNHETGMRHSPDMRETGKRHEVRYIINNLDEAKDRQKTGKRQAKDRDETATNYPNPITKGNGKFNPPSLEEVKSYCLERKNNVSPDAWLSHYQSNGWRVGPNPMKDWKAAIRTWENSKYSQKPAEQQGFVE